MSAIRSLCLGEELTDIVSASCSVVSCCRGASPRTLGAHASGVAAWPNEAAALVEDEEDVPVRHPGPAECGGGGFGGPAPSVVDVAVNDSRRSVLASLAALEAPAWPRGPAGQLGEVGVVYACRGVKD